MAGGMPGQTEKSEHLVHNDACIVESLRQYFDQESNAARSFYFCSENVEDFGLKTDSGIILHPLLQDYLPQTRFTSTLRDLVEAVLSHAGASRPSPDAVEKALEKRVKAVVFVDSDSDAIESFNSRIRFEEEIIFRRHQQRETGYRDDYQDFGSYPREFESDWRQRFKTNPPSEAIERAKAIRKEIYEAAVCECCGGRPEWLTRRNHSHPNASAEVLVL